MRKLMAVFAIGASALVLAGGVSANPDAGQVIQAGFDCAILDGNGNSFITTNSTLTLYQNKVVLRCGGYGAPAPQLTYWTIDNTGLLCNIGFGYGTTANWYDKVGYNGNSQLVCTAPITGRSSASSGGVGASG
jgi:hypothetical protein